MGRIEDAVNLPVEDDTRPIVGYWNDGQVYCPQCADALSGPSHEAIRTQSEPVHDLVCLGCGSTVGIVAATP